MCGVMDPVALIVGISWTLCGVVCLALAIPLARGKVRRNALYGVRFRESFQSDEAWMAINQFGGRRLMRWCLPLIAVGAVAFFLPLQRHPIVTILFGFAPLIFIFIPVVESWRFAKSYGSKG
jgi:hypothetical protein